MQTEDEEDKILINRGHPFCTSHLLFNGPQ